MVEVEMSAKEAAAILKASFGGQLDMEERKKLAMVILKYRKGLGEVF
jgi:uncharacterized protein YbgA (DUF1722 family)